MRLAIASGKGGTGKTTIAVNLAATLGAAAQLLDADVEEPDAHLFLPLEKDCRTVPVQVPTPEVNLDRCNFCGVCGDLCQFAAIVPLPGMVLTFPELCHGCGGCALFCPQEAVQETPREIGEVRLGTSRYGVAGVYGVLRVGTALVPPVIRAVKSCLDPGRIAILDGPPGNSCALVTAIRQMDFVLLVTEPTPFGRHDLEIAVATTRRLGLPLGVVINRAAPGGDAVQDFCRQQQVPVLLTIPQQQEIAAVVAAGELLIEHLPGFRDAMARLYEGILQEWRRHA